MLTHAACYNWPTLRKDLDITTELPDQPIAYLTLHTGEIATDDESMSWPLHLVTNDDNTIYLQPKEDIEEVKGGRGQPLKALPAAIVINNRTYRVHFREHDNKPALCFMSEIEGEKFIKMPSLALWSEEKRNAEANRIARKITDEGIQTVSDAEWAFIENVKLCG